MAKIFNYTIIILGTLFLLNLAGLTTASGQMFNYLFNDGANPFSSLGYIAFAAIFTTGVAAAIIIGSFTKQSTESWVVAPVAGVLFSWAITDMYSVITLASGIGSSWVANLIKLIMWPLIAGYFIAIVQWWRGNDI